jgi:prepilin peptidase CpaA
MAGESLQMVILLLGIGLYAAVVYSDLRTRRIPNELVSAIAALGLMRMFLVGEPGTALYSLAAAAALFAVASLLFWRGLVGGGDVKLAGASVLVVGHHDLPGFLVVMSLSGAVIALAMVAAHSRLGAWLRPIPRSATTLPAEEPSQITARLSVPYGVAIATAGMVTLALQSFVPG